MSISLIDALRVGYETGISILIKSYCEGKHTEHKAGYEASKDNASKDNASKDNASKV